MAMSMSDYSTYECGTEWAHYSEGKRMCKTLITVYKQVCMRLQGLRMFFIQGSF